MKQVSQVIQIAHLIHSLVSRGAHPLESTTYFITKISDKSKVIDGETNPALFKAQERGEERAGE